MKKLMLMGHALIFTMALALTGSVAAESPCQGLAESECKAKDICVWVDGKKVKDYCRAKPGHGDDGAGAGKKKKKKEKSEESAKSDDEGKDKEEKKEKKKSKKKKDKKEKDDKKEEKAEQKEKKSKKKKKKDE